MNHLIALAFGKLVVLMHILFAASLGYLFVEINSLVRLLELDQSLASKVALAAVAFIVYILVWGIASTLVSINNYLRELTEQRATEAEAERKVLDEILKLQERQTVNSELLVDFVRESVATQQFEASKSQSTGASVVKLPDNK